MTHKDAMDGGYDPLRIDPHLFDDGTGRENSPSQMRAIATELRINLDAMLGHSERPNGNVKQISTEGGLTAAQIGQWNDALALASTVGSHNAGKKFADVYTKFIEAYQSVVEAIEASAANHDKSRRASEGEA
ncbi:hypothetical protein [Nonomuraea sp. NPDC002799]